mmetsp:Transcript_44105/g.124829  ORF Transcript_44105/g.124829 Transcript_44105/m.124829 type:complete len:240 (-) Transcript_44105:276-995(-)
MMLASSRTRLILAFSSAKGSRSSLASLRGICALAMYLAPCGKLPSLSMSSTAMSLMSRSSVKYSCSTSSYRPRSSHLSNVVSDTDPSDTNRSKMRRRVSSLAVLILSSSQSSNPPSKKLSDPAAEPTILTMASSALSATPVSRSRTSTPSSFARPSDTNRSIMLSTSAPSSVALSSPIGSSTSVSTAMGLGRVARETRSPSLATRMRRRFVCSADAAICRNGWNGSSRSCSFMSSRRKI